MYSIVLAMVLAPGNVAPAADLETEIRELKRSIAELREEQNQARIDALKMVIVGLRERITDDKLDELRRDIHVLRHEHEMFHASRMMFHMPPADHHFGRATISVEVPSGATFVVNDKEVPVPAVNSWFVSPPLEPGKDYFYDCKVTVTRDGKPVTKIKRVRIHAGELVRINYEEMESR
ncbi:MAG TPA: TIGR03000 domain-containing protein [Gemmataceae bacterium]|nr:TIGR03000 domain-containing protein [Gemmataceae bacterium]